MGMFKRGYEASREEKKRQDEARENAGKMLWKFFLKDDGDEAELRFLTEEPVNFYEHNLQCNRKGKTVYEQFTCTGDESCPFCADGDKPVYKGAYLVVDRREFEYTDSNGKKKTGKNQLRLFVQGMKVVSQLDRISNKYGLSNRDVTMIRLGSGTQTTYTVERGNEQKLTQKEIEELLPEKLRKQYDGTMESLYAIIEEQLMMHTKDYNPDKQEDDEEDESDGRDKLIGIDSAPKKKLSKSGSKKSLFKSPQNSLKPKSAKSLLKGDK